MAASTRVFQGSKNIHRQLVRHSVQNSHHFLEEAVSDMRSIVSIGEGTRSVRSRESRKAAERSHVGAGRICSYSVISRASPSRVRRIPDSWVGWSSGLAVGCNGSGLPIDPFAANTILAHPLKRARQFHELRRSLPREARDRGFPARGHSRSWSTASLESIMLFLSNAVVDRRPARPLQWWTHRAKARAPGHPRR
jgi:hypothetical protein